MTSALHSLDEFETALNERYAAFSLQPAAKGSSGIGHIRDSRTLQFELADISVTGVTSSRSPLPSGMQDRMHLLMIRKGMLRVSHRHRLIDLHAGDLFMLDSAEGYVLDAAEQCSARTIEIMRTSFGAWNYPAEALSSRLLHHDHGVVRLLSSMVDSLAEDPGVFFGDEHRLVQDMLARLLINVRYDDDSGISRGDLQLMERMRRWVRAYPEKGDLSPEMLAVEFGLSRRNLYRIFSHLGTTPAQWLWTVKLEQGHEMIADPSCSRLPVSAIAYQCGFHDPAHFSRAFKKRYGITPKALRTH